MEGFGYVKLQCDRCPFCFYVLRDVAARRGERVCPECEEREFSTCEVGHDR